MISVLASAATGRTAAADRTARLSLQLDSLAGRLRRDLVEDQALVAASASAQAIAQPERGETLCRQVTERIRTLHGGRVGFAIADDRGVIVCALAFPHPAPDPVGQNLNVKVADDELMLSWQAANGWTTALRYPPAEVTTILDAIDLDGLFRLDLIAGDDSMLLLDRTSSSSGLFGTTAINAPLTGLGLRLRAVLPDLPPTAAQWIAVALPILMTVGSALLGWLLVSRLFTNKLARLTRQVENYRPGAIIALDEEAGGSPELDALGDGLRDLSALVARNIGEVESGLERQTALTREVHHRVKNNLQVIASLISLHSRAAEDPVARDAYRVIQRRVDALSVVGRNHFAGTEMSGGVSLPALVNELASGLRAVGEERDGILIGVEVDPVFVSQDTATSVAFLVTELAELCMVVSDGEPLAVTSAPADDGAAGGTGIALTLTSTAFRESARLTEQLDRRYGRVVTGLSRQLRSPLHHDPVAGTYRIVVGVMEQGGAADY